MTTPYLESYLTGYRGIRNFGSDSYSVLRELVNATDDNTLESDQDFVAKIIAFVNDDNNIWAKRSGEYVVASLDAQTQRQIRIVEISEKLGMDSSKIDSLITRIYNALVRHMRKHHDFNGALEYSKKKISAAIADVESES